MGCKVVLAVARLGAHALRRRPAGFASRFGLGVGAAMYHWLPRRIVRLVQGGPCTLEHAGILPAYARLFRRGLFLYEAALRAAGLRAYRPHPCGLTLGVTGRSNTLKVVSAVARSGAHALRRRRAGFASRFGRGGGSGDVPVSATPRRAAHAGQSLHAQTRGHPARLCKDAFSWVDSI